MPPTGSSRIGEARSCVQASLATEEEFHRLGRVLNEIEAEGPENLSAVTAIRLLMLTGCRLNEIQTLRWEDVDLDAGELRLPDSKTGVNFLPMPVVSLQCHTAPN